MIKMNNKYIVKSKREDNDNKNINMKHKSVTTHTTQKCWKLYE